MTRLFHASLLTELLGGGLVPTSFMNGSPHDVGVWLFESKEASQTWLNPLYGGVVYSVLQAALPNLCPGVPGEWVSTSQVPESLLRIELVKPGPEIPNLRSHLLGLFR